MTALHKLRKQFSTQLEMADSIGVKQGTVADWLRGEKKPSVKCCLLLNKKFNIPLHELRPDIYPAPSQTND